MTPDTNLLIRVVVLDDARQTEQARAELDTAETVFLTLPTLCEFCWVLRSRYRFLPQQIAGAITALAEARNVFVDTSALSAGLSMLEAGGDFADGVIAEQGHRLGSHAFVSFDRAAVRLLNRVGFTARSPD